jgi:polysaccharide export outer membrane protein
LSSGSRLQCGVVGLRRRAGRGGTAALFLCTFALTGGCEVRSFFDPSKTGRFVTTPTTIPIIERIDVIEREERPWARARSVVPEDLLTTDLTYRLAPGDLITVEVLDLLIEGQVSVSQRRIDAAGNFRLPVIGDIRAAGLTAQEFQDEVVRILDERVLREPLVNVVVEEGAGFMYTVYGGVPGQGVYALRRADLRILDALAQAGGVALPDAKIYVIRQVPLHPRYEAFPPRGFPPGGTWSQPQPPRTIESLIEELEGGRPEAPRPERQPIDIQDLMRQLDREGRERPDVRPALLRQEGGPVIDIDDLDPGRALPIPGGAQTPAAEPPAHRPAEPGQPEVYIYVEERGEWVRMKPTEEPPPPSLPLAPEPSEEAAEVVLETIIEIPFQRLREGDSSYNIVVRPDDRIHVQQPATGVVYIDGEILRPGVYTLPPNGRLSLSRLVAAAGGLGPLAMPQRVDLTRMVDATREATIRLDLDAIRNRAQPDVYLKPDDHLIIGTDFWALPLAIFRNGFRMTYGFGFLLDRNFGNDVFGPPPVNITNE